MTGKKPGEIAAAAHVDHPDILVNNAGILTGTSLLSGPRAPGGQVFRLIDIEYTGP